MSYYDSSAQAMQYLGNSLNTMSQVIGIESKSKRQMNNQAKIQWKYAKKMHELQQKTNKENWDLLTAYNHPSAMRSRLEEAGMLGASLFEGAAPGSPSSGPDPSTGSIMPVTQTDNATSAAQNIASMSSAAKMISDIKVNDATAENLGERSISESVNRELMRSQAAVANSSAANTNVQTELSKVALSIEQALQGTRVDTGKAELSLLNEKIDIAKGEWLKLANKNSLFAQEKEIIHQTIEQMKASVAFTYAQELAQKYQAQYFLNNAHLVYQMTVAQGLSNDLEKSFRERMTKGDNDFFKTFSKDGTLSGEDMRIIQQYLSVIEQYYGADMAKQLSDDFSDSKLREVAMRAMGMFTGLAVVGGASAVGAAAGSASRKTPTLYGPDGKAAMWSH